MQGSRHWLLDEEEPPRRRLDGRAIVERAHALVHEGGSAALSMRTLASDLGTSTSALYRHVPSKQWLLIAIADHVLADVDTSGATARRRSARGCLETLSEAYRAVLAAHPHLHDILVSQVTLTPSSIRIAEAALRCLRDLGIGDGDLLDAYNAWSGYVVGFSVLETKPPLGSAPDPDLQGAMRAALDGADPAAFPMVTELRPVLRNLAYGLRWQGERLGDGRSSFDWGLRALLDGYERARSRRHPSGSRPART